MSLSAIDSGKFHAAYDGPASNRNTLRRPRSLNREASTAPADPPPTIRVSTRRSFAP